MAQEGRPTDYNENILVLAGEYIASAHDFYDEKSHEWIVDIPSIEGLGIHLNVSTKTLYNWGEAHPEFLHILERLRQFQAKALINKGLSGKYNPTIAKMMLTKHGYSDKLDVDHTTKGDKIGMTEEEAERLKKLFPPKEEETNAPGDAK